MDNRKIRILFVCTGNICRSPMAEAIFSSLVEQAGIEQHFEVKSAGTRSYHIGERPHPGTQQILQRKGICLNADKAAQKVIFSELHQYDYVIAMDFSHQQDMAGWIDAPRLLEFIFHSQELDVPDPYYDGNFEQTFNFILEGCKGLLNFIRQEKHL